MNEHEPSIKIDRAVAKARVRVSSFINARRRSKGRISTSDLTPSQKRIKTKATALFNRAIKKDSANHEQNTWFSVTFVPHNSGKPYCLRVPRLGLKAIAAATLLLVAAACFANGRAYYLRERLGEASRSLEDVSEKNKSLNEREKDYEKRLKKAQKEYNEDLKFYERKAGELEGKIQDLERTKDDIYNLLSQKTDGNLNVSTGDLLGGGASLMSMGGPGESSLDSVTLDSAYSLIENRVRTEADEYASLYQKAAEVKRYVDSKPSIWPVRGIVTSEVGSRPNPFGGSGTENHSGLDISCPTGTPVKAAGSGVVTFAGFANNGYGNLVIIDHGYGIVTMYGHNSEVKVSAGQRVDKGDIIAKSGSTGRSTGPHVHYEVRVNGAITNPRRYL
ncbi:MAG: peptidoglycan DD-metalloendopeptidase family protein [Clostridiales bacterium]|jgi:murein DD-endopeptidase MepM/ murein hydrolase activator NlpD|nr:peptidoglycan DD-metalloendopeptidase family protein [Clostridiales bacterium]